jgi:hypothetical protein
MGSPPEAASRVMAPHFTQTGDANGRAVRHYAVASDSVTLNWKRALGRRPVR